MSRVVVEIATDNDAFRREDGSLDPTEVGRLLRSAANRVLVGRTEGPLVDLNGATVGTYTIEEDS